MVAKLAKRYAEVRKASPFMLQGSNAALSLDFARTLLAWEELEAAGLVRIKAIPEESPDFSYLDTWEHLSEQSKERMIESIQNKGVWIVIGQFRINTDDGWDTADSVGDCQGYDNPTRWQDNAYVSDIMAETITQLRMGLKDRFCPHCGHRI